MTPTANLIHIVLRGGYPPTTARNPRPFGMPPFATVLNDADVAELLTFSAERILTKAEKEKVHSVPCE